MVSVGIDPATGKPLRKSAYGKTRIEARDKLRAMIRALEDGLPLVRQDITVETLMTEYLAETKPNLRPNSYKSYEQASRIHIVPKLGTIKITALDVRTIQLWQRGMLDQGTSAATVKIVRSCLSRGLDMGMRYEWISRNVVELTPAPAPTAVTKKTPQLDNAMIKSFIDVFMGHRLESLVCVMIGCGLRPSEALGLTWESIDFDKARLTIHHQLATQGKESTVAVPKTKSGYRSVPVPGFVLESLQRQKERQQQHKAEITGAGQEWGNDLDLVFTTDLGTALTYNAAKATFVLARDKAGLPQITLHKFRHLYASVLVSSGVNMKVVSTHMGHAQIGITLDRYSHLLPDVDHGVITALENALNKTAVNSAVKSLKTDSESSQNPPSVEENQT